MSEVLIVNRKILERDTNCSASRQVWQKQHLPGCNICRQQKNEYRTNPPYLKSCKQDKTGIITCTFLCGFKCSYRVGIITDPLPIAKKNPTRRIKFGRNDEMVVYEHKYVVSQEEAAFRREGVRKAKELVRANRAAMKRGDLSRGDPNFWKQFGL